MDPAAGPAGRRCLLVLVAGWPSPPDGDLVVGGGGTSADQPLVAYRFDGTAWSVIDTTGGVMNYGGNDIAAAADGTIWIAGWRQRSDRDGRRMATCSCAARSARLGLDARAPSTSAGPSGIYRVRR